MTRRAAMSRQCHSTGGVRLTEAHGFAALDLALVLPAVLALVLALIDIATTVVAQAALDHAVGRAAARIERGSLAPDAGPDAVRTEVCVFAAIPLLPRETCGSALLLDMRPLSGSGPPAPLVDGTINAAAFGMASGGDGEILLLRAGLRIPMLLPLGLPLLGNLSDGGRLVVSSAMTRVDPLAGYNAGAGS